MNVCNPVWRRVKAQLVHNSSSRDDASVQQSKQETLLLETLRSLHSLTQTLSESISCSDVLKTVHTLFCNTRGERVVCNMREYLTLQNQKRTVGRESRTTEVT